ncbi:hypothetical protein FRC0477_01727 [Corynebacterium diphtheriae]|nr:hypothetical protein FRC0477_01727 [Corynebacterium diphtheriae]
MKHYIKLPALFTAAVFFVVACSTPSENESKPPQTTVVTVTPTPTENKPVPSEEAANSDSTGKNKIIPVEALDSVWVPALCDDQAGNLVGGVLPESLQAWPSPSGLTKKEDDTPIGAYTDINGDGRDEAILAYYCDRGSVSWPNNILIYDNDLNYLTKLDREQFSLGGYSIERRNIRSMSWDDNSVTIESYGWAQDDVAAAPSAILTYRLTMPNGVPQVELIDQRPSS